MALWRRDPQTLDKIRTMKRHLPPLLLLLLSVQASGQAANTWSVKISDAIISRYSPTINAMTSKGWEYSNTIILHGMEKVYNQVNDASYLAYIKTFIDSYLNADGTFKAGVTLVSLDRIHPGISVLFLYEKYKSNPTDSAKYRTAATNLRNVLVGASASYNPYRTPVHKIFWHKQSGYDNIMMLDGMYMAHPFLAKYGSLFNDNAAIDTAVNQTLFAYNQLYQSGSHLIKHAWKEPGSSGTVSWDDVAGNSTSVWSRAMGWFVMALVDELKFVPSGHARRSELLTALSNLAAGIASYQDASSHLWFQVVDKTAATLSGNYLETSGSAMFVYALKTAVDSGWINSATYLPVAQSGWTGIQTKIGTYSDSKPQILDFAPAMSVQNTEALYVQASLQPVDCPTASGTQHPHGYAAVLMAASVMEFPMITLPLRFIRVSAAASNGHPQISWQVAEEMDVDHFEVEKSETGRIFSTLSSLPGGSEYTYVFTDNEPYRQTVYYRILAFGRDGQRLYSPIVNVRPIAGQPKLTVSPNPVSGDQLRLALASLPAGNYQLKILGATGDLAWKGSLTATGASSEVFTIRLPQGLLPGYYSVIVENGSGKQYLSRFIRNTKD